MIREFQGTDTDEVMRIWLSSNQDAHAFIPKAYWCSHFTEVQQALLQAQVFVYDTDGGIQGFVGMMQGYIAGIFVDKNHRSCGIGKQLLTYVKQKYDTLSLRVYQKNTKAAAFYHREGFFICAEGVDEDTGEKEYTMLWER